MNGLREASVNAARQFHSHLLGAVTVGCVRWKWWWGVTAVLVGCNGPSREVPARTETQEFKRPRSASSSAPRDHIVGGGERLTKGEGEPLPRLPSYRKQAGVEQPRSQLVACSELGFVRLLPEGFEGYRLYDRTLTFRSTQRRFTHVVAQAGHSYLLLGPNESLLYYQPHTHIEPLARLPALGPFRVWPDARHHEWVWVHYLRDDAVHRFELPKLGAFPVETRGPVKASLQTSVQFSGFDGSSVERTAYGEWVYTRAEDEVQSLLVSGFGEGLAYARESSVMFTSHERRPARSNPSPARTLVVELSGYPFSMAESEQRLALITHTTHTEGRDWQLEVIEASGAVHRVALPNRTASSHAPDVDAFAQEVADRSVCLVPGKPLAVVGGKTSVRLFDYRTGESLLVSDR